MMGSATRMRQLPCLKPAGGLGAVLVLVMAKDREYMGGCQNIPIAIGHLIFRAPKKGL